MPPLAMPLLSKELDYLFLTYPCKIAKYDKTRGRQEYITSKMSLDLSHDQYRQ